MVLNHLPISAYSGEFKIFVNVARLEIGQLFTQGARLGHPCTLDKFLVSDSHYFFALKMLFYMVSRFNCPKDADGMANSVDPDHEQSDLGLHCFPRPVCPKT